MQNHWKACIVEQPGFMLNPDYDPMHAAAIISTAATRNEIAQFIHFKGEPRYEAIIRLMGKPPYHLMRYSHMIFRPGLPHGDAEIDGRTAVSMNGSDVLALALALLFKRGSFELDQVSRLFDYRHEKAVWEWLRAWVHGTEMDRCKAAYDARLTRDIRRDAELLAATVRVLTK